MTLRTGYTGPTHYLVFLLTLSCFTGLFRYAIIQSGSPLAFWAVARKDWPEGYNIDERDIKKHHKKYLKTLDVKSIKEIKAKVSNRKTGLRSGLDKKNIDFVNALYVGLGSYEKKKLQGVKLIRFAMYV